MPLCYKAWSCCFLRQEGSSWMGGPGCAQYSGHSPAGACLSASVMGMRMKSWGMGWAGRVDLPQLVWSSLPFCWVYLRMDTNVKLLSGSKWWAGTRQKHQKSAKYLRSGAGLPSPKTANGDVGPERTGQQGQLGEHRGQREGGHGTHLTCPTPGVGTQTQSDGLFPALIFQCGEGCSVALTGPGSERGTACRCLPGACSEPQAWQELAGSSK